MQVKAYALIAELKVLDRWIEKLTGEDLRKPGTGAKLEDLVCGCFDLLQYSPTANGQEWQARKPQRRHLDDPRRAARSAEGRRVIRELIALTISEVEASVAFRPDVHVGVLPIREPRKLSTAKQNALSTARAALRRSREQRNLALAQRVATNLTSPRHPRFNAAGVMTPSH